MCVSDFVRLCLSIALSEVVFTQAQGARKQRHIRRDRMYEIRQPTVNEILEVVKKVENGFDLEDREIWIYRQIRK